MFTQEMTMCNMEALIFYFLERYDLCHLFLKLVKRQGQNSKYQQIDLYTRNIHVKYPRYSTHYSNGITSKVKVTGCLHSRKGLAIRNTHVKYI